MEGEAAKPLTQEEIKRFNEILGEYMLQHNDSHLEELFSIFDRNGSGTITPDELKVVLETVEGHVVPDAQVQAMMKTADVNSDGVIELKEFMNVIRRLND